MVLWFPAKSANLDQAVFPRTGFPRGQSHPVSYPNRRPPEATKMPIMMAGVEDPATLSGLRQPMAKAMAEGLRPSSREQRRGRVVKAIQMRYLSSNPRNAGRVSYRSRGQSPRDIVVDHLQVHPAVRGASQRRHGVVEEEVLGAQSRKVGSRGAIMKEVGWTGMGRPGSADGEREGPFGLKHKHREKRRDCGPQGESHRAISWSV